MGLLVDIVLYNEERMKLLLPQVEVFIRNWVPSVPIPSTEIISLLSSVVRIIEADFKLNEEVPCTHVTSPVDPRALQRLHRTATTESPPHPLCHVQRVLPCSRVRDASLNR